MVAGVGSVNRINALRCKAPRCIMLVMQGHLDVVQHLTQCNGIDLNAVDGLLHHIPTAVVTVSAAVLDTVPN